MAKFCDECGRKHYAKGKCSIHYRMPSQLIPKPLVRKSSMIINDSPKRVPVNKVSAKRAIELRAYAKIAPAFKLANPDCNARLSGCTGITTDIHHQKGRENWRLNDVRYFLPVCRNCHSIIEIDTVMAWKMGFSFPRTAA